MTATKTAPAKKTAPAAPPAPAVEKIDLNTLDLDEPTVTGTPQKDISGVPAALRHRVDNAFDLSSDPEEKDTWTVQTTPSDAVRDAVIGAMRLYAENHPDGRLTLHVKLVEGGFKYRVREYVKPVRKEK